MDYITIFLVVGITYSVIGNAVIYFIVKNKGIETKFIWTGTPGYLHKILVNQPETFGKGMRIFSLSTIIVFVFVMLAGITFSGVQHNA